MSLKIALLHSLTGSIVLAEVVDFDSWPSSRTDAGSITCAGNEHSCTASTVEDAVGLLQVQLQVQRSHGAGGLVNMTPTIPTPSLSILPDYSEAVESAPDHSFMAIVAEHMRSAASSLDLARTSNASTGLFWSLVPLGLACCIVGVAWLLSKCIYGGQGTQASRRGAIIAIPVEKKKKRSLLWWWHHQATAKFKFSVTYASRVAAWTVLIAVIPLSFHKGREMFADWGFNVAYIVCNFLFIVGPDVGTTVQTSMSGLLGNFWAGLMLYVLNAFFPGGYHGDNTMAFWVGLFSSIIFVLAFMYLNVNDSVQFFALYNYVGYMMTYLNPGDHNDVSKAFNYDYKGTAENALILYAIGAFFALLCSLLPWPVTAREKFIQQIGDALEDTHHLYRQILDYYSGSKSNMEIYELMSNVAEIRQNIDVANGSLETSWYECFGLGSHATSRMMMKQFIESLSDIVRLLDPLIAVVRREDFEGTHVQLMEQIRNELFSCVDKTQALFKSNFEATVDGVLDPGEIAVMETNVKTLKASCDALHKRLKVACDAVSQDLVTENLAGEHYFVHMTHEIAQHVTKCAEGMLAPDQPHWLPPVPTMDATIFHIKAIIKRLWDPSVLLDKAHIKWVFRSTLSLALCFWLGYFGWSPGCSQHGRSCFITPYDASMATLVIVLLSKSAGTTFKNALDRLTAVVLADIAGQSGYVLVGHCTPWGRFSTAVLLLLIVAPNMYVSYAGGSYAAIGMRNAAIGAMSLLAPCSDDYITAFEYAKKYHGISDVVIGAFIMMMVDMTFGGKPASSLAKSTLIQAINDFKEIFNDFKSDSPPPKKELQDRLVKNVKEGIDTCRSLCQDAAKEPRFWRQPWRPVLYQEIEKGFLQLYKIMYVLIDVILDEKPESQNATAVLKSLDAWGRVVSEVDDFLVYTDNLSIYIIHMNRREELIGLAKLLSQSLDDSLSVDAIVKELNQKSNLEVKHRTTHATRFHITIATLQSLMRQMRKIQHQVVLQKGN